ncbi:hypothetical protein R3I93_014188 [Phoxinus phoxinus]|uniref:Uncharacterized protein n=1 Tax=Phoxinus phoxinus TaxID=58324 RepID=A0AAN9CRK3_9TELE
MSEFTHTGRFWEYQQIQEILAAADPLARLLEEMQKKGLVVRNIPPVLPAPTLPSLPPCAPQSPGEGADEPDDDPASEDSSGEDYQSTQGSPPSSGI